MFNYIDVILAFLFLEGLETRDIVNLVIALVGSGGLLGGIYALMKLRPEAGQIVVTAAQGALVVSSGVIETLREELERLTKKIADLEAENERILDENQQLRVRVRKLEQTQQEIQGVIEPA